MGSVILKIRPVREFDAGGVRDMDTAHSVCISLNLRQSDRPRIGYVRQQCIQTYIACLSAKAHQSFDGAVMAFMVLP